MEDYFKKLKESPPNAIHGTKYGLFYNKRHGQISNTQKEKGKPSLQKILILSPLIWP